MFATILPAAARVLVAIGLAILVASTSSAQALATNFDQLRLKVKKGDTLSISYQSGGEVEVSLVEVSNDVLVVQRKGMRREIKESQVRQIRQRLPDPLWQGALIGAGIGAGLGGLVATSAHAYQDCNNMECLSPVFITAAIGAGVGVGFDALIKGPKVIYQASAAGLAARVTVLPVISRKATGAAVRVTF